MVKNDSLCFAADLQTILRLEASISSTPSWASGCQWGWSEIEYIHNNKEIWNNQTNQQAKNIQKWFQMISGCAVGICWRLVWNEIIQAMIMLFNVFVWFVLKLYRTNVHFLKLHRKIIVGLKNGHSPHDHVSWRNWLKPRSPESQVMIGSAIWVFLRLESFYFYLY